MFDWWLMMADYELLTIEPTAVHIIVMNLWLKTAIVALVAKRFDYGCSRRVGQINGRAFCALALRAAKGNRLRLRIAVRFISSRLINHDFYGGSRHIAAYWSNSQFPFLPKYCVGLGSPRK